MSPWLLVFLVLVFSACGALLVARAGHLLGLVDRPSHRSSHKAPTPKGGGVGILAAFVLSAWALDFSVALYLPPLLLSLLSLYGDKIHLNFRLRLVAQFLAALWFLTDLYPFDQIAINLAFLAYLGLVLVFMVGTANFYNFMDGINGLAGGTGVVAFGLLAVYGTQEERAWPLVFLAQMVALACLAFLPFNLPKAKVFMGDVASVLLGFLFAGLVLKMAHSLTDFLALCGTLFPFYADELTTMLERIKRKESLTQARRTHLYQVLANEGGMEHFTVSALFWGLQLVIGLVALELRHFGLVAEVGYLGGVFLLWAWVARKVKLAHLGTKK